MSQRLKMYNVIVIHLVEMKYNMKEKTRTLLSMKPRKILHNGKT